MRFVTSLLVWVLVLAVAIELGVHARTRHLVKRFDTAVEPPALRPGGDVARQILAAARVEVPVAEGDVDCYSPFDHPPDLPRQIQLADGRLERRSTSAVAIAAHEAAHAVQHASGQRLFWVDLRLAVVSLFAGPIGIAVGVTGLATGWTELLVAAAVLLSVCAVAGVTRTVVEIDASRRALDALRALELPGYDERAARQLLTWCGATYVADSVLDLGALARRAENLGDDVGGGGRRGDWGDGAGAGSGGDGGGGSGGGCGGGGGGCGGGGG